MNALPGFALAAVVRASGHKVVLVGEGGDEVFAGYPWYRLCDAVAAAKLVPKERFAIAWLLESVQAVAVTRRAPAPKAWSAFGSEGSGRVAGPV